MQSEIPPSVLSEREREILVHVANGLTNKEIAVLLNISTNTVKVHLRNIFSKIDATTRTEAALVAIRWGLVSVVKTIAGQEQVEEAKDSIGAAEVKVESVPARKMSWQSPWFGGIFALFMLMAVGIWVVFRLNQPETDPVMEPQSAQQPRWQTLSSPGFIPLSGVLTIVNQTVFVIGGKQEGSATGLVRALDLNTGEWSDRAAKPTIVSDVQAGVVGGKIYIPGGISVEGQALDVLEVYNPASDSWFTASPMPEPRSAYSLVVMDSQLYVFGGWDGRKVQSTAWLYDPLEDKWRQLAVLPEPIMSAAAVTAGGRIYLLGGHGAEGSLSSMWIYQPGETGEPWQTGTNLPAAADHICAASIIEFLYAFQPISSSVQSAWLYTINARDWTAYQAPDLDLTNCQATAAGTRLFVMANDPDSGEPVIQAIQAIYTTHFPNLERP